MDLTAKIALSWVGMLLLAVGGLLVMVFMEADTSLTVKILGSPFVVPIPAMAAGLMWYSMRES